MPVPPGTLGAYALGATTGLIAATLAGGSTLFSARWGNADNFAVISYVSVSVAVVGAITTAVAFDLDLDFARAFTVSDTLGTAMVFTGGFYKLKTNFPNSLFTDMRIATTVTLTPGTRTVDTQSIGLTMVGTGTAAGSLALGNTILYDRATNDYPIVLSQDEGILIRTSGAGPATGTFEVAVNVRWTEMSKQVF